jgi:hypothetical protein
MSAKETKEETKGHAQHVAFVLQFGWNNKRQAFNSLAQSFGFGSNYSAAAIAIPLF